MSRTLVALLCVAGFTLLTSFIQPYGTNADPLGAYHRSDEPRYGPVAPQQDKDGGYLIGELVSLDYIVWIYGNADGPRYTVLTHYGRILANGLPADEVYRSFPDLDPNRLFLPGPDGEGPEALMIAEPLHFPD